MKKRNNCVYQSECRRKQKRLLIITATIAALALLYFVGTILSELPAEPSGQRWLDPFFLFH